MFKSPRKAFMVIVFLASVTFFTVQIKQFQQIQSKPRKSEAKSTKTDFFMMDSEYFAKSFPFDHPEALAAVQEDYKMRRNVLECFQACPFNETTNSEVSQL